MNAAINVVVVYPHYYPLPFRGAVYHSLSATVATDAV